MPHIQIKQLEVSIYTLVVSILALLLTGYSIYLNNRSMVAKVDARKEELTGAAKSATKLAQEIIEELKIHPSYITESFRDTVQMLSLDRLVSENDFENLDMNIGFSVSLFDDEADISTEIDYDVGEYKTTKHVSQIVFRVLNKAFNEISEGILGELDVSTEITGVSDGIKVKPHSIYRGELSGEIMYYNVNLIRWKTITLLPNKTKFSNELIALLRALYLAEEVNKINFIKKSEIKIMVKEVEHIGPRKTIMHIRLSIKNAVLGVYDELNPVERILFNQKFGAQK